MTFYEVLRTELAAPAYAGMSDAQAAAAINAKTVTRKRAVQVSTINAIADGMGLTPRVRTLLRSTNAELAAAYGAENVQQLVGLAYAALGLFEARYETVDFTDPVYEAAYQQVAGGLRATGLIDTDEKLATFLGVGSETVKWATVELNYPHDLTENDIAAARAL
jgi:hypothetical protein